MTDQCTMAGFLFCSWQAARRFWKACTCWYRSDTGVHMHSWKNMSESLHTHTNEQCAFKSNRRGETPHLQLMFPPQEDGRILSAHPQARWRRSAQTQRPANGSEVSSPHSPTPVGPFVMHTNHCPPLPDPHPPPTDNKPLHHRLASLAAPLCLICSGHCRQTLIIGKRTHTHTHAELNILFDSWFPDRLQAFSLLLPAALSLIISCSRGHNIPQRR